MISPEKLPEVTENVLHNLTADESLKFRILQKAADTGVTSGTRRFAVPVLCSALGVLLLAVFVLNGIDSFIPKFPGNMIVFAAGQTAANQPSLTHDHSMPDSVLTDVTPEAVSAIEYLHTVIDDPVECTDLIQALQNASDADEVPESSMMSDLCIRMKDGRTYHFSMADPYLIADGKTWKCPDFFRLLPDSD